MAHFWLSKSAHKHQQPSERISTPLIPYKTVFNLYYDSAEKCTWAVNQDIGNPSLTYSNHGLCAITTVSRLCALLWQVQRWLVPQGVSGRETDTWRPHVQPKRPSFTGNGIYQKASIADLDATTPLPCRYSYSVQRLQLAQCISYDVYRSRREVHKRMWCNPIGGNVSMAKNSITMFHFGSTSTQTSAARLKTRNNLWHTGQHSQWLQRSARHTLTELARPTHTSRRFSKYKYNGNSTSAVQPLAACASICIGSRTR